MGTNWSSTTLGDLADLITKGTTPTTLGSRYSDAGVSFIKVESITDAGDIDLNRLAHIDEATHLLLARSNLKENDVLFSIAGTIGRVALIKTHHLPANTNQAVALIRPSLRKVDPKFLYYLLRDERRLQLAQSRIVQSVQANFSLSELAALPVELPPFDEQRAISGVLGALDDKIELNRRMNMTLEEIARALFKSWFVDFDPVRAKAEGRQPFGMDAATAALFPDGFEDSEMGEVPTGWVRAPVGELVALNPESWTAKTRPTSLRYVDLANTKWGVIEHAPVVEGGGIPSRAQRVLRVGDTIIGTVRPGNGSYALISEEGLTGSSGFAVLRPHRPDSVGFVYLAITTPTTIETLQHLADGGAYPAVRPELVASQVVSIPSAAVRLAFSETVSPLLARMAASLRESRVLQDLRDYLLPKLLSGEVRVRDAEKLVGQAV